ncbi:MULTISPECIES: hypothetical protein [Actinoalloteichus]|uniref:hypothetical protein n=1 Tax=Actinoalloteichus TaxID=65496 RepID=UPI0012F8A798|nr:MULTISPECIES: hypothetical protein [Actinoalloteichus]
MLDAGTILGRHRGHAESRDLAPAVVGTHHEVRLTTAEDDRLGRRIIRLAAGEP